jgi:hypothetical protein
MTLAAAEFENASNVSKLTLNKPVRLLEAEALAGAIEVPWVSNLVQHLKLPVAVTIVNSAQ